MVRPCCDRRTIDSGGKCACEGPARLGLDLIKPEPQRGIYGSCPRSWQIHERNFARSPRASRLQNRFGRTTTPSAPTRPCLRRVASTSETVLGERPRLRARSRTPCGMSGSSRREHATSRPAGPEKASARSARPFTRGTSASTNTPWPVKCKCPRRSNQPHPRLRNSARTASGILSATSTWRASGRLPRSPSAMRRDTCVGEGVDRRLSSTRTRRPPASRHDQVRPLQLAIFHKVQTEIFD
jgi:hypothetical protein